MARDDLLARFLVEEPVRGPLGAGASSVLVPIVALEGRDHLLFTRRTTTLAAHPGEVSFPGGRHEPGDGSLLETALRETEEEIGTPRSRVALMGHLTDFVTHRGNTVVAYVARVAPEDVPAAPRSLTEVAELLLVEVDRLRDPLGNRQGPLARGTVRAWDVRSYEARAFEGAPEAERRIHYWHLDDSTTIWGITGELVARFLHRAFDWEPPVRPRVIRNHEEVLP